MNGRVGWLLVEMPMPKHMVDGDGCGAREERNDDFCFGRRKKGKNLNGKLCTLCSRMGNAVLCCVVAIRWRDCQWSCAGASPMTADVVGESILICGSFADEMLFVGQDAAKLFGNLGRASRVCSEDLRLLIQYALNLPYSWRQICFILNGTNNKHTGDTHTLGLAHADMMMVVGLAGKVVHPRPKKILFYRLILLPVFAASVFFQTTLMTLKLYENNFPRARSNPKTRLQFLVCNAMTMRFHSNCLVDCFNANFVFNRMHLHAISGALDLYTNGMLVDGDATESFA